MPVELENVVHLGHPTPIAGLRDGVPGTLVFERDVVWRTSAETVRIPLDAVNVASAAYVGHTVPALASGLGLALLAQTLGLSVVWGVGALWGAAALRLGLDRLRPRVTVTLDGHGQEWTVHSTDPAAFAATQVLRARLPRPSTQTSLDELLWRSLGDLRAAGLTRRVAVWNLAWLVGLPLLVWLGIWGLAVSDAVQTGKPIAETFVIPAMGPPFSVILWPVSGLFGLLVQAPLAPFFVRWAGRQS
ncbi:MAG: hypothetical protein R3F61_24245 [Myxococcota bacterium]